MQIQTSWHYCVYLLYSWYNVTDGMLQISMHAYLVHANMEVNVSERHKGFDADALELMEDLRVPVSIRQFHISQEYNKCQTWSPPNDEC